MSPLNQAHYISCPPSQMYSHFLLSFSVSLLLSPHYSNRAFPVSILSCLYYRYLLQNRLTSYLKLIVSIGLSNSDSGNVYYLIGLVQICQSIFMRPFRVTILTPLSYQPKPHFLFFIKTDLAHNCNSKMRLYNFLSSNLIPPSGIYINNYSSYQHYQCLVSIP